MASSGLTPAERTLRARQAAHESWANTDDPSARGRKGADGLLARFEREIDPDGKLDPADRRRRAEHKRQAHMTALAFKAAKARRLRSGQEAA